MWIEQGMDKVRRADEQGSEGQSGRDDYRIADKQGDGGDIEAARVLLLWLQWLERIEERGL